MHPVKTITSGEGGLVTTNNKFFYNRVVLLRSHGINKDKNFHWKYDLSESGFNYRISDVNCALALGQLKKINKFITYRRNIFNFYKSGLKKIKQIVLPSYERNKSSYHLFLISINFSKIRSIKDKFFKFLKNKKIFCQYHYIPIYKFKLFNQKLDINSYKGAEFYYKNTISLPIFYDLKISSQKNIINKIKIFLNK